MDEKSKNLLEDANVYRGAAGGMSDYYRVEAKVRMRGFWKKEREEVNVKIVVRMSEFKTEEVREAFVILIANEWDGTRIMRVVSVKEGLEMFKSTVMKYATRVCGYKGIGRKERGSAYWDEEIKEMVRGERRLFVIYVTDKNERNRGI